MLPDTRKVKMLLILLIIFGSFMGSDTSDTRCTGIEILHPGTYHSHEVDPAQQGTWFGLVEVSDGLELRQVEVRISKAFDGIRDSSKSDSSTWSGRKVSTTKEESLVLLIRGLPDLKAGPVKTWFCGRTEVLPELSLRIGQFGRTYRVLLSAKGDIRNPSSQLSGIDNYTLRLNVYKEGEWKSQDLVAGRYMSPVEDSIALLWAGDLDNDGKPDFLIDTGGHYNVTEYKLYLSSCAKEGELVSCVACFRRVGC
jgi:hypothetical protein